MGIGWFPVLFFYNFIFGCTVSVAMCRLFLVAASGGFSLIVVHSLLIVVASHCGAWALEWAGFSSCGTWAWFL